MMQKLLVCAVGTLLAAGLTSVSFGQAEEVISIGDYQGGYSLASGTRGCSAKLEIKLVDGCLVMIEQTTTGEWRDLNHFCKVNNGPRISRDTASSFPIKVTTTKRETSLEVSALTDVYELATVNAFAVTEVAVRTASQLTLQNKELVWEYSHSKLELYKMPIYASLNCTYERIAE